MAYIQKYVWNGTTEAKVWCYKETIKQLVILNIDFCFSSQIKNYVPRIDFYSLMQKKEQAAACDE